MTHVIFLQQPQIRCDSVVELSRAMRCGYKSCRSLSDVKNAPPSLVLSVSDVERILCRNIRGHCQNFRFCCKRHRDVCYADSASHEPPRGPREGLSAEQYTLLFNILLNAGAPWAAVLTLLQTNLGERASCMCVARRSWLHNLDPACADPAMIRIPCAVNGKTVSRDVPMDTGLAKLLARWTGAAPLKSSTGAMWPFPHCPRDTDWLLFPGLDLKDPKKLRRDFGKAVSRRGYLKTITHLAVPLLAQQRQQCRDRGGAHAFDMYPLNKLGTHSLKKTSVMLLRDVCRSTSVVGSICGTSAATLERVYDQPTFKRKQAAVQRAFGTMVTKVACIADGLQDGKSLPSSSTERNCVLGGTGSQEELEMAGGTIEGTKKHKNTSGQNQTGGDTDEEDDRKTTPKHQSVCGKCGCRRGDVWWRFCANCGNSLLR